jgi:hypothetical protein
MRRARHGDRGIVLILAMMVIVVLGAVALVSVQSTVGITSRSGSFRNSRVAHNVTAGGSEATMAMGAWNPKGFNDFVVSHGFKVSMADVSPAFFDMASMGSFGREVANVNTAGWGTRLSDPVSSHRAPGYEIGEYCFRKYFSRTDGYYMNEPLPPSGSLSAEEQDKVDLIERHSQKRFLTTMYVGPVDCH